jgi:hypothetical protein
MGSSQTRFGNVDRIFRINSEKRLLDAQLARLCVLFEDMRIEITGMLEVSLPKLDILDPKPKYGDDAIPQGLGKYRRLYFTRRSIATVREFTEALRLLDENDQFESVRAKFTEKQHRAWGEARSYFHKSMTAQIDAIRNDIGGHFGQSAALKAIVLFKPDNLTKLEVVDGKDYRLHFANEVVASALCAHLPDQDPERYAEFLHDVMLKAYGHCVGCVKVLVEAELGNRFNLS